jgi:hypothetical protein
MTVAPVERGDSRYAASIARLKTVADLNASLTNKFAVSLLFGEELNDDFVVLFGLKRANVPN